jgi:hypothetical protein
MNLARTDGKAAYLFSTDGEKVSHVAYVPKSDVSDKFNAKTWSAVVTKIIGGKVSADLLPPSPPHTLSPFACLLKWTPHGLTRVMIN